MVWLLSTLLSTYKIQKNIYIGITTVVGHMVSRTFFIDIDVFYNTVEYFFFLPSIVFAAHAMIEFLRSISPHFGSHYCFFIKNVSFFENVI